MAYIGKSPVIGNFVKLDAITAVNGQAAYTMQNGGSNFTDYESVNQFLVSLNGTIQAPTDSFTVSGSTLTFASNLSTGDVIDFIMVFGNSLSAGTPTDGTVTAAKLNDDIISGQTALASEPADTDEFLVSDAGTLKRIDYSLIKGGGKILQVVSGQVAGTNMAATSGYVGAGLSITPTVSTSKVLIIMGGRTERYSGDSNDYTAIKIVRDTTDLYTLTDAQLFKLDNGARQMFNVNYLDTPNTTSSTQYRIYSTDNGSGSVSYYQWWTLMEVGA